MELYQVRCVQRWRQSLIPPISTPITMETNKIHMTETKHENYLLKKGNALEIDYKRPLVASTERNIAYFTLNEYYNN